MQHDLMRTMPAEYRRDKWVQVVFEACQGALQGHALDEAAVLGGELLLSRMSEAQLAIEERLCAIVPTAGQSIEDRRSAVAARWRSGGAVTELLLSRMSEAQLAIEERLCAIVPTAGQSIEDRRSAVAARWRSGGAVTITMLQRIADSWLRGEVQVSYTDGKLVFTFVNSYGVPDDLDTLRQAVDAVRPAHIPTEYVIRYRTWKEVRRWERSRTRPSCLRRLRRQCRRAR